MKILADENIALVHDAFSHFGELEVLPGRDITAAHMRNVDALLVRSVTQVSQALLEKSSCRFVGTATSGVDHIDVDWLQAAGIRFADARGCNAESVVDYVFSSLACISTTKNVNWLGLSFGIIGCGEVGRRLAARLLKLGIRILVYDPLLPAEHEYSPYFASLEECLQQPIVTLHTPLTKQGLWPSYHMLNADKLRLLLPEAILINAARGGIIDTQALLIHKQQRPQTTLIIDAWENEPHISNALLDLANIATPHIAGYSRSGKVQGTAMIQSAFCRFFGLTEQADIFALPTKALSIPVAESKYSVLNQLVLSAYDVREDHHRLAAYRGSKELPDGFDGLRRHYPERHEFSQFEITTKGREPELLKLIQALGFVTDD